MFFIYVSELQEEVPMEKLHQKRESQKHVVRGIYPFPLISKGKKVKKHVDRGSIGHRADRGSIIVSINAKGGDCWKIDYH
jgi:hypothetical protein